MDKITDKIDDKHSTPVHGAAARIDADTSFGQAITGVKTKCRQLAMSINAHDFEGVEYTARDATSQWLTGRAACRRLIERSATSSPYADAARRLLEDHYMTLLELFGRATRTIEVPRMRRALAELRGTLMTAMAHPLLNGGEPPDDRSRQR
jgi:hypothetical protein